MSAKRFYKLVSSNYRANRKLGQEFSNNSFPICTNEQEDYKFQMANYILWHVFDDKVIFKGIN